MTRGSRKHVLDWTERKTFLNELGALVAPAPVCFTEDSVFVPRGHTAPEEARLDRFGPKWLPGSDVWSELQNWWLVHKVGANTPNWDIAVGCLIEGRPGLVLVEAKANHPELSREGKWLRSDASRKSRENHMRIGSAIDEACVGWNRLGIGAAMTCDSHYQLANRLAFTWKLAKHGIPVVLVHLGFTGDAGIADVGRPFDDDADWQAAFADYASATIPLTLFDRRLEVGKAPVWLMSRSRAVLEASSMVPALVA